MRDKLVGRWRDEDGAALALIGIGVLVLMFIGAIAVDLSALARRGQTLQNTADAAALAGAAVWAETGDQVEATKVINDIIRQNGVGDGDSTVPDISFVSPTEVLVGLTDTEPDVFLGVFINGVLGDVSRDATGRLETCENGCDKELEIPRPFSPITALGSGDGYVPVSITPEGRLYGINHDDDLIACVDRQSETACWTNKDAMPYGGPRTGSVSHAVTTDTRIWWTAQEPNQLTLFCWQTLTEAPCPPVPISNLPDSGISGQNFDQRGGGTVVMLDEDDPFDLPEIYVFTDDHRVHCYDPGAGTSCGGYAGGILKTGGLGFMAPLDRDVGLSGSNIDRIVDGTKIYHTLHLRDSSDARDAGFQTGVWLDCWDTAIANTCGGFAPYKFHDEAERQEGRIFFHRTAGLVIDGGGVPDAVCSTGLGDIQCTTLNGLTARDDLELEMVALSNAFPAAGSYSSGMGVHMWHEPTNRLFLTTPRRFSTNHCWDFATNSYCGNLYGFANGTETQDYGFIYNGNCIFALGHNSIFWAFTTDLVVGCPGEFIPARIDKCVCGPIERWGNVKFEFDIGPTSPFTVLNIQIKDPAGNILIPDDGSEWLSIIGSPTNTLDLSNIPTTHSYLDVLIYAEATTTEPWDSGDIPTVFFGFEESPHLTD